ncbi:MAG: methyltransferase [Pedobacter sp.]|nr:methyltransferase [Pedobacter sp.]
MKNFLDYIFSDAKLRAFAVRFREVLGVLAAVLLVWGLGVNKEDFWIAFAVAMIGEFIQLWCFASLDKNSTLAFRGPYAFVRNPMYLGRYFIVLGVLLLLDRWQIPVIVIYTLLYWFYMANRVKREEALLKQVFGQDYANYCAEVRAFLPRLTPYRDSTVAFWDWRLFRNAHGPSNLGATLAGFAVIFGLLQYFA